MAKMHEMMFVHVCVLFATVVVASGNPVKVIVGFPGLLQNATDLLRVRENTVEDSLHKRSGSGGWQYGPPMQAGQFYGASVTLASGDVLRCGGMGAALGGYGTGAECSVFSQSTLTWTAVAPMPIPMFVLSMVVLSNTHVLAFAGSSALTGVAIKKSQIYNPAANTWSQTGDMVKVRLPFRQAVAMLSDGRVLLVGGQETGITIANCEVFDPSIGGWLPIVGLDVARIYHSAVTLQSGKVLVCGGTTDFQTTLSTCTSYDPASSSWTPAANMNKARASFSMELLPNGNVLAVGGFLSTSGAVTVDGSSEIYDPVSNTWTPLSATIQPRYLLASMMVPTGVMMVGGLETSIQTSAACEIYDAASQTISACPALNSDRYVHFLCRLGTSMVATIGGVTLGPGGAGGTSTIEVLGIVAATTSSGTTSTGSTSSGTTSSGTTSSGTTSSGTTSSGTTSSGTTSTGSTGTTVLATTSVVTTASVLLVTKEAQVSARYFWQSSGGNAWAEGNFSSSGAAIGTPFDVSLAAYQAGLADDTLKARDTRFVRTRLAPGASSSTLFLGRFSGAVVPTGATIIGVKLVLTRSSKVEGLRDVSMQLRVAGGPLAASERFGPSGSPYWPVSETNSKIGGPADMWGLTASDLRPDVVNSPTFGVVLTTKNFHRLTTIDGFIGEASMYFTYTTLPAANMDDKTLEEPSDNETTNLSASAMGFISAGVSLAVVALVVAAIVVARRRSMKIKSADVMLRSVGVDDVCIGVRDSDDVTAVSGMNPLFQRDE